MECLDCYPNVNEIRVVPIANAGNTCFAGSVMQALMQIPKFVINALRCYPRTKELKAIELFIMRYIMTALESDRKAMHVPEPALPEFLGFSKDTGACAGEFYMFLMDQYKNNALFSEEVAKVNELFEIEIEVSLRETHSEFHSSIMLQVCQSIQSGVAEYLNDCLLTLDDGSEAVKHTRFAKLPPILCIVLVGTGPLAEQLGHSRTTQINQELTVPDKHGTEHNYILNSIIVNAPHGNGHYVAYVHKNNVWYACNDSSMRELPLEDLQDYCKGCNRSMIPHLLFYVNAEHEEELLHCDMEDSDNAIPVITRITQTEVDTARCWWLSIVTDLNFNPQQLIFEGVCFRESVRGDTQIYTLREQLTAMIDAEFPNDYQQSSLWLFVNGTLVKQVDDGSYVHDF